MFTEKHIAKAEQLIKSLSPTMVVRELCTPPKEAETFNIDGEEVELPQFEEQLPQLTQAEAEEVVFKALERQRAAYQKFQVSKETIMERYYDLYNKALETKDIKAAKTILDKLTSELGLSVDNEITASGSDKIILKIE